MKEKNNQKGFGIIESIVSIYIITMGLLGLMSLIEQSLKVQRLNKNAIISSELAQEGLELVRNIRDDNWKNEADWRKDISGSFIIDYRAINDRGLIYPLGSTTSLASKLYLHENGFYDHDSSLNAAPTIFSRFIETSQISNEDGLNVVCHVKWADGARENEYSVATKLYNWKNAK